MKRKNQRKLSLIFILAAVAFLGIVKIEGPKIHISAQTNASPTPASAAQEFNQAEAIAKLREQIKGRETEPAEKVFKNIQTLKGVPAGRLLGIMEMGFARSLGVGCAHCHSPGKWEAEDKAQKQIAREMWTMMGKINGEQLKNIKNLQSATPTVNCTTCHRGQIKPALNLPEPPIQK
jgi:hypothetical protein